MPLVRQKNYTTKPAAGAGAAAPAAAAAAAAASRQYLLVILHKTIQTIFIFQKQK